MEEATTVEAETELSPTEKALAQLRAAFNPTAKMLVALQDTGKHVYAGTVDEATVRRRRTANKAARRARRAHR